MKWTAIGIALISTISSVSSGCWATPTTRTSAGGEVLAQSGRTYRWNFDESPAGKLPEEFVSALGDWKVEKEAGAPTTPGVLRQTGTFRNPDFPRVLVKDLTFADLTLRVRCRPESGEVDRACGLLFRAKDSDNYYVTRANPLEGNVRLYEVVNGSRKQFASADLEVTSGEWHTLEVRARGSRLSVSWDGREVLSASDSRFERGKIGLWTKADSVTAFDDLEATAE